jgi:glycine/D-amino acid oxidase-like deaminating enzyme
VAHDYAALHAQLGAERARACYRACSTAVKTLERLIQEERIDCDYLQHGKLKLASKAQHVAHIEKTAELIQRDIDPNVEFISRDRIRSEVLSDQFHAGLLQKDGGQMHMRKFSAGLANAAAQYGAKLYEQAGVTDIARNGDGYKVVTARGTLQAKQVLVATGPSRQGPFDWYRRRLAPVGSFIIATEPLPPELLLKLFPNRRAYTTSRIMHNYFRVLPDGRLLWGGRARFTAEEQSSDLRCGQILQQGLVKTFPELANVRIDYCWGGLVDITADRFPRAGRHEGVYFSMGYSGHGTQMSTHMGQMMAEVMSGNETANPWRDFDWPAIPGHTGKPWFLPLVGAYFSVKDIFF